MDSSPTSPSSPTRTTYRVDAEGCLSSVSEEWLAFALANGAPELTRRRVIGQPLRDFVTGDEARRLYSSLYRKVRESRSPIAVPFRCDAPSVQRYMELEITPLADGGLEFVATTLRTKPTGFVALIDRGCARSSGWISICSWCKCVQVRPSEWCPLEDAIARFGLLESSELPRLYHAVCPDCRAIVQGDVAGA